MNRQFSGSFLALSSRIFSLTAFSILSLFVCSAPSAFAEEIFLDSIVASIDDMPITLSEVERHLTPPRRLTPAEAASDPEFARVLDGVILNRLIEVEARQRKLAVLESEINEYLGEISKRNNMTREEFIEALKREHHTEAEYREQVKSDILKSKLASALSRGSSAVSDAEVDSAIQEHRGKPKTGTTVTLRQIVISNQLHDEEESEKLIAEIKEKLEEGEKFDDLARIYSESPDRDDGGSLGAISENELNSDIADAVRSLDIGEISSAVTTSQGSHLFFLEDRSESNEQENEESSPTESEREQMRAMLRQKKMESKMTEFFTSELYKLHSVDKKI